MGHKGLKMQTNCGGVSAGEDTTEAAGGTPSEEVLRCGGCKGFNPAGSGLAVEPGEAGGLDSCGESGDEERRGEGSGGVVEGLVFRGDVERVAAEFANKEVQLAARRWVGGFDSE